MSVVGDSINAIFFVVGLTLLIFGTMVESTNPMYENGCMENIQTPDEMYDCLERSAERSAEDHQTATIMQGFGLSILLLAIYLRLPDGPIGN